MAYTNGTDLPRNIGEAAFEKAPGTLFCEDSTEAMEGGVVGSSRACMQHQPACNRIKRVPRQPGNDSDALVEEEIHRRAPRMESPERRHLDKIVCASVGEGADGHDAESPVERKQPALARDAADALQDALKFVIRALPHIHRQPRPHQVEWVDDGSRGDRRQTRRQRSGPEPTPEVLPVECRHHPIENV